MSTSQTLGLEQARTQLPRLLDNAQTGGVSVVTRHGKACAAIVPMEMLAAHRKPGGLLALRGTGKGLWSSDAKAAIAELRNEWK